MTGWASTPRHWAAVLLALAGGTLDATVFLRYGGVFANAQTGNLVMIALDPLIGRPAAALAHLPPVLGFSAGVIVSHGFAA